MKNIFSISKIAAIPAAILLAACTSDAVDFAEISSVNTISAFAELPADTDAETSSAAVSELPSENEVTTVSIQDDGNFASKDTVQTSAGKTSEQTAADEIEITAAYTSQTSQTEAPFEPLNSWNTTAKSPEEAQNAAKDAETSEFSARIISISDNYIFAEVISEEWVDILGSLVQINTSRLENVPECSPGDYAEIITGEEIGITEAYPPKLDEGVSGIKITRSSGIELSENSVLAKVVNCTEVLNGEHYAIVVQAFNLTRYGYEFETEISMKSSEKFSFGDWVKITFAEDTIFMESYPLQVPEEFVLGIEKI